MKWKTCFHGAYSVSAVRESCDCCGCFSGFHYLTDSFIQNCAFIFIFFLTHPYSCRFSLDHSAYLSSAESITAGNSPGAQTWDSKCFYNLGPSSILPPVEKLPKRQETIVPVKRWSTFLDSGSWMWFCEAIQWHQEILIQSIPCPNSFKTRNCILFFVHSPRGVPFALWFSKATFLRCPYFP